MKRTCRILLLLACALCLAASGCGGAPASAPSSAAGSLPVESAPGPGQGALDGRPEAGEPGIGVVTPGADTADAAGDEIELANQGKVRIPYTGNQSGAAYVVSAADLPDYPELKQYDDAYFEDHALVLVTESVNSGSIDVGILAVHLQDPFAAVTLYHEMPQGADYGTADMATWLLWAEVDAGLDGYSWRVENPALASGLSSY